MITPTLASWQHDCRKAAVLNGWTVSFEPYASKGEVIALFFRKHMLVSNRVWLRPANYNRSTVPL